MTLTQAPARTGLLALAAALMATGCFVNAARPDAAMAAAPMDGQIPVPSTYRSWVKFVPTVDKAQTGQVREIYINPVGLNAMRGMPFPAGTVSVMEIHAAKKAGDTLLRDAHGRLVKDGLAKIFVMAKGDGWGAAQPGGVVANGDWVYGAWEADGKTPVRVDFNTCRACHAPLASTDFVARYDEHFSNR